MVKKIKNKIPEKNNPRKYTIKGFSLSIFLKLNIKYNVDINNKTKKI